MQSYLSTRFGGMAGLLVLAIGLTWGAQFLRVENVKRTIADQEDAVVTAAFDRITAAFTEMQEALLEYGNVLSVDPALTEALGRRDLAGEKADVEIVRIFSELQLPDRWSVELYDPAYRLVAWNGFSLPFDRGDIGGFDHPKTAIAEDADWRHALTVWHPVRQDGRLLGVLRIMQLIQARSPVQNEFLKDYRIDHVWQRGIRLPVRTQFETAATALDSTRTLVLTGFDGALLGRVIVEPPSAEHIITLNMRRFEDVMAFWASLLLLWTLAGLWLWQRGAAYREQARVRFGIAAVLWWVGRYAFLWLDVPARWQQGKAPLNVLFDPTHMASTLGAGLMRSPGDFLVTALFTVLFALAVFEFAKRQYPVGDGSESGLRGLLERIAPMRLLAGLAVLSTFTVGLTMLLAMVTHHAVVDSTLDFFGRDPLIPLPLILVFSCGLILLALSVILLIVSMAWMVIGVGVTHTRPGHRLSWGIGLAATGVVMAPLLAFSYFPPERTLAAWPVALLLLCLGLGIAVGGHLRPGREYGWLTLRGVLPAAFVLSVLVYPLLYEGMEDRRRQRMEYASTAFDPGHDTHVSFAVRDVLTMASETPELKPLLTRVSRSQDPAALLDFLAADLVRNSMLSSLAAYDVSLVFLDSDGVALGRFDAEGETLDQNSRERFTAQSFHLLRRMYEDADERAVLVAPLTGRRKPNRIQYAGIALIDTVGWILASAEPRLLLEEANTPLLRILVSSGNSSLFENLSLAVFEERLLVRSFGRRFGRYRLDEVVADDLTVNPVQWRAEEIKGRRYQTYYRGEQVATAASQPVVTGTQRVVAVRTSATSTFDHLFYLLRLTVAGLLVGIPFYGTGLFLRWRAGLLPAPRVQFRDKVLNAFLLVGIFAVMTVGFAGIQVVTEENDRAIQSWLRQHLQRVEDALSLDAKENEMTYSVLERTRLDSLAARTGLDLNLYRGEELLETSRAQLVNERLVDRRLPIQAHATLNVDAYKFAFVEEKLGTFFYTAGYWTLFDEQGEPRYVLSVPTIPEQERIEEERSRTLAYLFGALLALVLLVMATASLLANALARPIARLRLGLQAVAQGHFARPLPVRTRDEIGELVETFNDMQAQLVESRRQLTQQERNLAWREMARQVAHEIKNPLTPMKLSLQHLRRAFTTADMSQDEQGRFKRLFDRITVTLVDQIDSLAHIANEFAAFARMPTGTAERVDCNEVIREAVSLMQEEAAAGVEISCNLEAGSLVLEADREDLRRIYINLIKNALEAFEEGDEGTVTITTRRESSDGQGSDILHSTVADTGRGIQPELQENIFEPNFSTKTSGAGLGLAIARRSLEGIGGEIGFETEPGRGTSFWLRVPVTE